MFQRGRYMVLIVLAVFAWLVTPYRVHAGRSVRVLEQASQQDPIVSRGDDQRSGPCQHEESEGGAQLARGEGEEDSKDGQEDVLTVDQLVSTAAIVKATGWKERRRSLGGDEHRDLPLRPPRARR